MTYSKFQIKSLRISIIIYFQIYFHYFWIYFSFEVWCISLLCRKWLSKILDLQTLWFINQQRKLFKNSCEKKSYMQKLNSIKTYMKKRMTYNMLSLWWRCTCRRIMWKFIFFMKSVPEVTKNIHEFFWRSIGRWNEYGRKWLWNL